MLSVRGFSEERAARVLSSRCNHTVNFHGGAGYVFNDSTHQCRRPIPRRVQRRAKSSRRWRIASTRAELPESTGPRSANARATYATADWLRLTRRMTVLEALDRTATQNGGARSGRTTEADPAEATMWRASLPTCASRTSRPTWRRRSAGVRSTVVDPRGVRDDVR